MKESFLGWLIVLATLVSSSGADAGYSNLFIFGDSLSDLGNNAFVLAPNTTSVPISGNSFIPTFPYASEHYTNGPVWTQTFATSLGLNANASLLGGTDYAFGGASTGPLSPNPLPGGLLNPFPASLETQAAFFLDQYHNVAPSDALYVVAGGGNDAHDALTAIGGCGNNPVCVNGIVQSTATAFATNIHAIVSKLETAGAKNIVVWDTPDVGKAPAILDLGAQASVLGSSIASTMNSELLTAITGLNVKLFDLFGLEDSLVANPSAFDLTNVTDACAAQFATCDPSTYLFWDGIHPTSAGHQLISNAMVATVGVPEPTTFALLSLGLAGLVSTQRRKLN